MPVLKIMIMDEDEISGIVPSPTQIKPNDFKFRYKRSQTVMCEKLMNLPSHCKATPQELAHDYFQAVTNTELTKHNNYRCRYFVYKD